MISYRPNPAQLATGLNEELVRAQLHKDFTAFKENRCVVDVTMKDNETIAGRPENLIRWVQIVRETGERVWG